MNQLLVYFTDPVLRAPTIGSMLMCLSASLVGVFALLRKQSLMGEALSHAAYPGVMLGVVASSFMPVEDLALFAIFGALISALCGVLVINLLQVYCRIRSDSALCFVLSVFFGLGVTIASRLQFTHTTLYQKSLIYLYGQAATMTDQHIYMYGALSIVIVIFIALFFKELQVICFDRNYAFCLGLPVKGIEILFFLLLTIAIIIGIRSVGVVLMSAMIIAPAAAALQYTDRLGCLFLLAGLFGVLSGYLGTFLSVVLPDFWSAQFSMSSFTLPTGPMIVLVATGICLLSLLLAPKKGLVVRLLRIWGFRSRCYRENILKFLWRHQEGMSKEQLTSFQNVSSWHLSFILSHLIKSGYLIEGSSGEYRLTKAGVLRAAQIVRLHRLWEVYLANYLGVGAERVHRSAEQMEHIITPELEQELTKLLHHPTKDPHQQPIPPREAEVL